MKQDNIQNIFNTVISQFLREMDIFNLRKELEKVLPKRILIVKKIKI